jgi:hypothetical protein
MSTIPGDDAQSDDVMSIRPRSVHPEYGERRPSFPVPVEDTDGYNLRPDPLTAATAAQMMSLLRQFRVWCGKPGVRVMARRANNAIAAATIHSALQGDRLPKLETLQAVVWACSGSEEDVRNWTTAWRKITLAEEHRKE